jgi:hypothetical protein
MSYIAKFINIRRKLIHIQGQQSQVERASAENEVDFYCLSYNQPCAFGKRQRYHI